MGKVEDIMNVEVSLTVLKSIRKSIMFQSSYKCLSKKCETVVLELNV